MLPQTALYENYLIPDSLVVAQVGIITICYVFVQIAMVFDRIFAVFTPFQYLRYRDNFNKALAIFLAVYIPTMICIQVLLLLPTQNKSHIAKTVTDSSLGVIYITTFFVLFTAYPAIAFKLWRQKQKIHVSSIAHGKAINQNVPTEAHIKALRLYVGVLFLFVLAYVPSIIHIVTGIRGLSYFFYINCVGNPVVYYMFNEKFGNDVRELVTKLKEKMRL